MQGPWEDDVAGLLTELSTVQDELLELLKAKCQLLMSADADGMLAANDRERQLAARLQACHEHRGELLDRAGREGLPNDSIRALAGALPDRRQRKELLASVEQSAMRSRLLQHHSLTNWVIAQRWLIHLSQMLEIVATGGRPHPTYRRGELAPVSGGLVDDAA